MAKLTGKDAELAQKIQALMLEYGYKTTRYFISHDSHTARFTINTDKVVKDAAGNVDPFAKAKGDFELFYQSIGFKKEWLGKTFLYNGKAFTLQGLNMAKPKNTCVITDSRGKTFIAPDSAVKIAIERAA